jgi:hypothetical protein
MPEKIGKIEKPSVEEYKGRRKLYCVPLVFTPKNPEKELFRLITRYWDSVQTQLIDLERKLGQIKKIYYELILSGGEEGIKAIEEIKAGYQIVKIRIEKGAVLEPIEDKEMLSEFMDWGKCLTVGLQNQRVLNEIYNHYFNIQQRRYEYIAKRIDESLKEDEAGMLLIQESQRIKFPSNLEVFHIAPPALEEIKQWIRDKGFREFEL